MTRFLSLRTNVRAGSVTEPSVIDSDGSDPTHPKPVSNEVVRAEVTGRDVVLAIHGFNVCQKAGIRSLCQMEAALELDANQRFFGVLWPGDYWLPVVNYPWESSDAADAGKKLAKYLNGNFAGAASLSIISHSLGARVLLEAAANLLRRPAQLCITAGAVDRGCLVGRYRGATGKAGRVSVLSSTRDRVLRMAYPAGDFISDIFLSDGDSPWTAALGLKGPRQPMQPPIEGCPIPPKEGFGHGDYFPPGEGGRPPAKAKWPHAVAYMRRAVDGEPGRWA